VAIVVAVVIDASALAEVVARSPRAPAVEAAFAGEDLVAPDLIGAEVLSVLRGWLLRSMIDEPAAGRAVTNLVTAPVRRYVTSGLERDIWAMRQNVSAYDATYVALARVVGCPLLTLDRRLAAAPQLGIEVRVPDGPRAAGGPGRNN
jgi:predicted nucleic acid-binding protein